MVDEGQNDKKIICVYLDDPEYMSYEHFGELPEHRLTELQRFLRLQSAGRQGGSRGGFSTPEEAVGAVRYAMDLYEKQFAPTR